MADHPSSSDSPSSSDEDEILEDENCEPAAGTAAAANNNDDAGDDDDDDSDKDKKRKAWSRKSTANYEIRKTGETLKALGSLKLLIVVPTHDSSPVTLLRKDRGLGQKC